jgi:hypothetical protein
MPVGHLIHRIERICVHKRFLKLELMYDFGFWEHSVLNVEDFPAYFQTLYLLPFRVYVFARFPKLLYRSGSGRTVEDEAMI